MLFDFVFDKMLVEVDGNQLFQHVSNWNSLERVQVNDIQKIKMCIEEGNSIIHIYQLDVFDTCVRVRGCDVQNSSYIT